MKSFLLLAINSGLITFFFSHTLAQGAPAPVPAWQREASAGSRSFGTSVAVDSEGNCLVLGIFSGHVEFGEHAFDAAGLDDLFLAKYNPQGDLLWLAAMGGTNMESGTAVALDSRNNVCITGSFAGTANIGGSNLTCMGSESGFIAKFAPQGSTLWVKRIDSPFVNNMDTGGAELAIDPQDNIFVTGSDRGYCIVAKYDSGGHELWRQNLFSCYFIWGEAIAVCHDGGIVVAGLGEGHPWCPIDFGTTNLPLSCLFLAKFSTQGTCLWVRPVASTLPCEGVNTDMALDTEGNIFISANRLLAKYDKEGSEIWRLGGVSCDSSFADLLHPHCFAFDRVRDFYRMSGDDLQTLSRYANHNGELCANFPLNLEAFCVATDLGGNIYATGVKNYLFYDSELDPPRYVRWDRAAVIKLATVTPPFTMTAYSNNATLSWPHLAAGFMVEQAEDLSRSAVWNSVPAPIATNGHYCSVTIPKGGKQRFFRLRHP